MESKMNYTNCPAVRQRLILGGYAT